ncbi:glutaredoxin domain-containing protein [Gordonia rhizosphera NBRC 16068]|uniref:glutaredoxin domain-containing protein n=1 Tax=Gordonia rhizosphera TaxID=83341 RepID=UPI003EE3D76D
MHTTDHVDGVEVLWRPGCLFCARLRRGLRRRDIPTTEFNIWDDESAAARVRNVTGGDETVPTVFVGSVAMVNPSVRQVVATIESEFPDRTHEFLGDRRDTTRQSWWSRLRRRS